MKLGILGGGQLGMMMCQAAKSIDISTIIYSDSLDSPAINFSDSHFIDKYDNLTSAKLKTNKIKNLGLFFEDIDDQIAVFSGPFKNNDISLKLDFLIRNGYQNAQTYP